MASKNQGAVIAPFAAEKAAIIGSVTLDNLRIIKVHDALKLYQFNTHTAKHLFYSNCDICTHHQRRSFPDLYGYNIGCFESVNVYDLGDVVISDAVNHSADRKS